MSSSAEGSREVRRGYPWIRPLDPLLVLVGLLPLVLLLSTGSSKRGSRLELIWPEGADTLSLSRDTLFSIPGRMGPVTVEVAGGRACIARSPCPGQDCVRAGWIGSGGQSSVCMPSGVLIRVIDKEDFEQGAPDAISY